jgi:hypothetical protein
VGRLAGRLCWGPREKVWSPEEKGRRRPSTGVEWQDLDEGLAGSDFAGETCEICKRRKCRNHCGRCFGVGSGCLLDEEDGGGGRKSRQR